MRYKLLLVFLAVVSCAGAQNPGNVGRGTFAYTVFESPDHTWGYDIYQGKQKVIHQPNIPGMAGNQGFASRKNALATARLAMTKIKRGEMPPTISIKELKQIKAL